MRLAISGVGVCATGMPDWPQAQSVLRAAAPPALAPLPRLAPDCLPAVERRRANATARLAISAAAEAMRDAAPGAAAGMVTVFSSGDGDGDVLASILAALAQRSIALSPTLFHNSVFNAPAGYWSIGQGAFAASVTISAGPASFSAGLREARAQIAESGAPVLYIAYDAPFPAALASFGRCAEPFACALLLAPDTEPAAATCGRIDLRAPGSGHGDAVISPPIALTGRFAENAAADALPLLHAIAHRQPGLVVLPYLDATWQCVEYIP